MPNPVNRFFISNVIDVVSGEGFVDLPFTGPVKRICTDVPDDGETYNIAISHLDLGHVLFAKVNEWQGDQSEGEDFLILPTTRIRIYAATVDGPHRVTLYGGQNGFF